MSVFSGKFKRTIKKATSWSMAALTAMTCVGSLPSVLTTAQAAGDILSNQDRGVIFANSRTDFRDETIYFLITTRFYDGDSSNNYRSVSDEEARNPESDPSWRGDFKGLIEKLDYLKALGFTAIWITPVVQNNSNYDYHGYHASNFNAVDTRYESNGVTYQTLIDACHEKGMKIIQDVVFNHTCRNGEEGLNKLGGEVMANQLSKPWPQMNEVIMSNGAQYDPNNIYHHNTFAGSGDYDNYNAQIMTIADDCFDLETENPVVANYLVDAYKKYIDMGVDAFRVDTARHISRFTMNAGILPHLQAEAEKIGNDDFYMFGEVCTRGHDVWYRGVPAISTCFYTWDDTEADKAKWSNTDLATNEALAEACYNNNTSGDNQPTSDNAFLNGNDYHQPDYSKRSNMGVIDFQMHWSFENAGSAFGTALGEDRYFNDSTWNVVYVNSHDYSPDFCSDKVYTGNTASWAENLSLMFTFRGIPCVYYGTEIEFQKGCPIDKGPKAMLSETGRAYYGDNIEGNIDATGFGVFEADGAAMTTLAKPLSQHLIRLNRIRQAVPALRKGQYSTEGCGGGLAFKRRYTDATTDSFALVTISGGTTFTGIPNGTYVDAVTGDTQNVTGGTLTANCSGQGNLRVYVLSTSKTPAPGRVVPNGDYMGDGGSAVTIANERVDVDVINVTGVTVSPTKVSVKQAETATVTASVTPSNASNKSIVWTSSDESVATVSGGTIKGVGIGTATVTATSKSNPTCKATVAVTVTKNDSIVDPTGITVTPSTLTLSKGGTGTLTATVTPSNATDKTVTWSSSNASVATVSNGTVTAVGVGTAVITAKTANNLSATATVTVEGTKLTYIENGVYFEKPSSWGSGLNAYIYDSATNSPVGPAWPGSAMTDDGNGVYYFKYETSSSTLKVIFNDGSHQVPGAPQPGFDYKNRGYYTENGLDHIVEKEEDVEVTSVTVSPATATVSVGSTTTLSATVAPSNATNKTVTWSTSNASVATVSNGVVTGVSKGSAVITATSNNGKSATATVTVKDVDVTELSNNSTISASTVSVNGSVTVSGKASGGTSPYQYAVLYKKSSDSSYTTAQSYSSTTSTKITFTEVGTYTVVSRVRDSDGTVASQNFSVTVKDVDGSLVNNSKISATSISLGESITVTGAASGGKSPYQYAVYYKKASASSYTTVQGYSTTRTATVTPSSVTDYIILVKVKDGNNTVVRKEFTVTVNPASTVLKNTSTVSATTVAAGTAVTIKGTATGGTKPYEFAYYYKKSSASSYSTLKAYSSATSVTFTPAAANTTYNIVVKVRDAEGTAVSKSLTLKTTAAAPVTTTISATTITLGKSVTVTNKVTSGTYTFAYFYKKASSSSWTTAKNYSSTAVYSIKPGTATTYNIMVKIKDSKGTVTKKVFEVLVKPAALQNVSTISATSITLGNSVKVTGKASGGTSPYTYAFYYRKSGASTWTSGQSAGTNCIYTFKPLAVGTYEVMAKIKDSAGQIAKKTFTVKVTKSAELTNTSKLGATTISLGSTAIVYCSATGGTAPYQYSVSYKKSTSESYTSAQSYSTNAKVKFTPGSATTYTVLVKVKDSKNTVKYNTYTLKVTK